MILEAPVRWWHCPSCELRDRTQQANPHTQFHNCPAIGVSLPLVEVAGPDVNARSRHVPVAPEDYSDRPVAAVRTERWDGSNDVTILAPTAKAGVSA